MKPSIFIASSKEGKRFADIVKTELTGCANITVWDENFFKLNVSTFDSLCKKAIMYDFAIVLYTKDDISLSRRRFFSTPRDNIIFEHGLFTGIIGRYKTYALIQNGVKIPSDLFGITYSYFSDCKDIEECCKVIMSAIKRESAVSRLSLLPSISIALSYFQNFLKPICEVIYTKRKVQYDGQNIPFNISKNRIKVVIPKKLEENLSPVVQCLKNDLSLRDVSIQGTNRKYSTFMQRLSEEDYNIIDLPVCLSIAYQSIKLYLAVDYIGDSQDVQFCIQKEISNFSMTLRYLLDSNNFTQKLVDVIEIEKLPVSV